MAEKISTLILTYNSSSTLEKCLNSVLWTDEIVIIDSNSTDSTIEIAKKYNCKIYQIGRERYSDKKKFGLQKLENQWVLFLDSDEELSKELQEEIQELLKVKDLNPGGYEIERKVYFIGKWINYGGWSNDFQLRLFNKDFVEISDNEVHEAFISKTKSLRLKNKIHHYTYGNIFEYIQRFNWYSSMDVFEKLKKQKEIKVRHYNLILKPLSEFLRFYISKKGYKDGIHGFILSAFSAIHKFCTYAKIWEYNYCIENNLEPPPIRFKDLVNLPKRN